MNKLAIRTASIFAAMTAVIILAFAAAITASAQSAPERPTDLTAAAIDHDTVSLNWSHPDPATVDHYQVLSRRVDSGAGITQVGTSTTTSFQHDGLEPESTYIYRVRPVNAEGEEGQRSTRAEATTPAEDTPAPEPDPTPAPPQRSDDKGQDNIARSSHNVLVSNTGQTSEDNLTTQDRAQTFTTGTNSAGYVLSSIVIGYNDTAGDAFTASVWTTNSSGLPNTLKHLLTAPGTFSQADLTFTAPANATLDASTTYTVKMERTSGSLTFKRTSTINPDEDSGAAAGWSIGDTYHYDAGATYFPSSSNKPMLIAIHGTLSTSTTSTDATLSDLELEDDSGTAITLSPSFVSGTTTYTAQVINSVDEITITPSVNDTTTPATYEIQNSAGTALTDADTNTTGFQVALSVGANIIKVEVTAEDASTETYTVTVTRAAAATPTVSISADKTTAVYREDTITYTLTRIGSTAAALPVSVTLTQTKNFLLATALSKTVTIPAGQTTETFTVAAFSFQHFATGTAVAAGTLTATVQDGTDYDLGTSPSVAVNIVIGPMIRIEHASYSVIDAAGALIVQVIARTGPGAPQPTVNTNTVVIRFEDVTTIEGTDYSTIQGDTFLFETGGFSMDGTEWKSAKPYHISITPDDIDEDDETFLLVIDYLNNNFLKNILVDSSGNACDPVDGCKVTVTIVDDDTAGVSVSKSAITVTEEDTIGDTYTVVLDSQPTANVTITIGGQGAADITATPTPLTFTTTTWATAQTVTVTAGNDTDTVTDTHSLTHNAASSDAKYSGITIAGVAVTVNDNDSTIPALSFDSINITVDEDGSQAALSVELSQTSTVTVTVDYATSDNTAEAGDDYTETSGTLTFAAGETVMAIIVPILDDAIYETLERFNVTLSNPAGATLPAFPGAQINIALDESPPTASIDDVTVSEGAGTMTLTLNLSHESSRRTPYRTQTSYIGGTATQGADYVNFISGGEARITVPAGDTQATLDITITDDTAGESSETITIRWDNDPTGGNNGDATPATINFTGTITDNDSGVQLTIQDASADETNSSIAFRIDSSETLTQDVTFNYSTSIGASDSAEADDFDPESAVSHTLSAGSVRGLIDIYLNDDDLYEGDETFTVTISNPVNASIADATATGTIIDDETQPTLEVSPASATEGDDIIFLVDLIGPLTEDDVTFNYATSRQSDDTSEAIDFTRTTGTETIAAGNSAAIITVPTYDDGTNHTNSLYEGDETFTFTIFNPTVAAILHATAKGTILDDERIPIAAVLDSTHIASENAGTIPTFIEFEIGPRNERPSQISLSISGTATQGDDYSITTTINVPRNINQFSAPLTIIDDFRYELTETAVFTLVAASDNIQVDPDFSTRTLTIVDNDDPPVLSFAGLLVPVDEDDGHAVLTVNKTGLTDVTATVNYETRQRPEPTAAVAGQDYVTTSGTLTFQPNETSKTISVPIMDDNVYEATSKRFDVVLQNHPHALLPPSSDTAVVSIRSEDPVPTASMADVTANERAGTMTVTLRLSHPSAEDIQYFANDHAVTGTATRDEDYVDFIPELQEYITVSAGQLSGRFDITLIDDGLEEEDENIHIRWVRRAASMVNPQYVDFTGTITDPPICDALGNLENTIVVMNLTGEITQPGQSKFHRIRLDPYRSYMIEAIGRVGEDMLGVEEHPNLTLTNPDIPAIWNARATSKWTKYGDRNDGDQPKNVIRRFLDSSYRTYKVEVNAGNNGTGTYQLKIRVNNICRLDENDNAHYQWAGGPLGYPKGSDLPAGIGGRQVLLTGTDWGNNNVTRPEMHHVLGDNWSSDRDEDWIGVDLEDGELYTVRLRTKNNLPERLQATGLKILGIYDSNGNPISGTASAGAAGKKVFVTDWTAPSTGRFHIAVGSEGADRTGMYWLSIIKDATN